jgi:hypothetical protein
MANAFISYSHVDENVLNRLHVHMANLIRDNVISSWSDHEILAGANLDNDINYALSNSDIFLAIVSPDYLSSNYCYEKEFKTALEIQKQGKLLIVPIIAQPCDWKSSPFGKMKAIPKDGKPISEWTNENMAYLNVVDELRKLLSKSNFFTNATLASPADKTNAGRNYKLKRDFDPIDILNFKEESFEKIKAYFKDSLEEISSVEQIQARFVKNEQNSFTCVISNRAKIGSVAYINVGIISESLFGRGDLSYSFSENSQVNSLDQTFSIEHDEFKLFWSQSNSYHFRQRDEKLSANIIAENLWIQFIEKVGISF